MSDGRCYFIFRSVRNGIFPAVGIQGNSNNQKGMANCETTQKKKSIKILRIVLLICAILIFIDFAGYLFRSEGPKPRSYCPKCSGDYVSRCPSCKNSPGFDRRWHYTGKQLELYFNGQMSFLGRIICRAHLRKSLECMRLMRDVNGKKSGRKNFQLDHYR